MQHKLESRLLGEVSITSDISEEELKSLLMKVKEESKKAGFKLDMQKLRLWHLVPLFHGTRWGNNGNSERLYFLGLQNHYRW